MTLRLIRHRLLVLIGLAALLATLAACDTASNAPPATTPIPPAATIAPATPATGAPTAALPASPPTSVTNQVPQAVPTGGAGQVPQAVPTGGAGQVPQAVPTGSPVLVTPGSVDPDDPPRISLQDLQGLLTKPDTLLVDVRTEASYQERHIKGAVSIPFPTLEEHIQDVPKDKFIVAYCQWPAENESASWARLLHTKYGFSYDRLKVLLGGLHAWEQAGLPLDYAETPTPFASVTPAQR